MKIDHILKRNQKRNMACFFTLVYVQKSVGMGSVIFYFLMKHGTCLFLPSHSNMSSQKVSFSTQYGPMAKAHKPNKMERNEL